MKRHHGHEVLVSIKCPVDPGVATLVEALSELPNVLTCDSCEGYGRERAHVIFRLHRGDLVAFVRRLAGRLQRGATISIEWPTGRPADAWAQIQVDREGVAALADDIRRLVKR